MMNATLKNAVIDVLVALGLLERPTLQPIPIPSNYTPPSSRT